MSPSLTIIAISVVIGLAMVTIGLLGPRRRQADSIEERLAQLGTLERPPTLEEIELSMPFTERVLRPRLRDLAGLIAKFTPEQTIAQTRLNLQLAGVQRIGAAEFLALRYVMMAVFGVLSIVLVSAGAMSLGRRLLLIPTITVLGHYLPVLMLGSRVKKRKHQITRALPDIMDLLTICVEAGLGFDAAMAKVVDKWDNELTRGFGRALQQIQLGKTRREALRSMADSMDVPDVSTFIAAVIQAETLGVSIAKVLRIQSDQMRIRRRQRAEEEARKAPVKIALPTVLLIFPALLIVILGPALLLLVEIFAEVEF